MYSTLSSRRPARRCFDFRSKWPLRRDWAVISAPHRQLALHFLHSLRGVRQIDGSIYLFAAEDRSFQLHRSLRHLHAHLGTVHRLVQRRRVETRLSRPVSPRAASAPFRSLVRTPPVIASNLAVDSAHTFDRRSASLPQPIVRNANARTAQRRMIDPRLAASFCERLIQRSQKLAAKRLCRGSFSHTRPLDTHPPRPPC